jgi:hypothetical protein
MGGAGASAGVDTGAGAGTVADASESLSGAMTEWDVSDVRELEFSPTRGNVIFASAQHGWGFDLSVFARMYARKLGLRQQVLQVRGEAEQG